MFYPGGSPGGPPTRSQQDNTPGLQSPVGVGGNGQQWVDPVAFQGGYIDFAPSYNPDPGSGHSQDYFYYSDYAQALQAADPGVFLGKGQISYGAGQTNAIAATGSVGTMYGGLESDPTINGIDYSQGASYANQFKQGQGQWNQDAGGNWTQQAYNQYTEPGYRAPTATAAAPTGVQSYGAGGQLISQSQASPTAFYYGTNGSAGSVAGTFSNTTPGQSSQFFAAEPSSLTANSSPNAGYLQPLSPSLKALTDSRSQN